MICGIDEAGRGCLAGDLVIAGCVLDKKIPSLTDSKKLSPKKREELFELLQVDARFHIVKFSSKDVDLFGLSACLKKALENIKEKFKGCEFLYDGNTNFGVKGIDTLVKADAKVPEVSAASILAKVTRDKKMLEADKLYPLYGFASHKGYGTSFHIGKIKEYGYTPLHRKSFHIKSLRQKELFEKQS